MIRPHGAFGHKFNDKLKLAYNERPGPTAGQEGF